MMRYNVEFSRAAKRELKKFDRSTAAFILAWIGKNLVGCENPRIKGKGLSGNLSGKWRYRIGDYRIIANISDETVTILVLEIAHRREVYND